MINPVHIYDNDHPGQYIRGDRFSIYRPQFNRGRDANYNSRQSNFSLTNDRERAISWNNNNLNNRNSVNMQQNYRSDNSQRANNMNRNVNNYSNNRSENFASLHNSMAYQNPREQNRFNTTNESNNRRANQPVMYQGNRNNFSSDRSTQIVNNNRMGNQREGRNATVAQRNVSQRNEINRVANSSKNEHRDSRR
jgi:hypothetical protein